MGLFTMPGGGSDTSTDGSITGDTTSGDGALSSLWGVNDVGSGYGVTTYTTPPMTTDTGSTLQDLQTGSSVANPIDLNAAFADTLGTVVAVESLTAQANTTGAGYYRAANGQVYPIGYGPGPGSAAVSVAPGGMLFWVMAAAVVWLVAHEERK